MHQSCKDRIGIENMHTVVLAGGFGTRLLPVLKDLPKPLAPVGNECFLEILLKKLKEQGLSDFTLCLHYMPEKIVNYFGDGSKYGVRINYSIETVPMGTGGALGILRSRINDTFCVINADTYLEMNVCECLRKHRKSEATVTIAVTEVEDTLRFGSVELAEDGFVKNFYEKDDSNHRKGYINAGFYIAEPGIFSLIPGNQPLSLEKDVFPLLLNDKNKIHSYKYAGNFFDIGIPSDYYNFLSWMDSKCL